MDKHSMLLLDEITPPLDKEQEEELRKKHRDEDWLFEASRRDLIRRTFLETADATYITARWQFFNNLNFEFFWNASHAIEKYLKAALLLSNVKANDLSHDIETAFKRAQENFGTILLPSTFPEALTVRIPNITSEDPIRRLRYDGPKSYIQSLNWQGGAAARYAMNSHALPTTDLYCFDLTVFLVRRIVENLQLADKVHQLTSLPDACPSKHSLLEKVYATASHPLQNTLGEVNYFLNPNPDTSKALQINALGIRFANSALYNNIVENAESNSRIRQAVSKRLAKWTVEHFPGIGPYKADMQQYL
ncbi:MAG: hypothetical protein R3C08_07685 [Hyphomonas sp.]